MIGGANRQGPRVVVEKIGTWMDADGSLRLLTKKEKEVLDLLKEVRDDGEWKEVPSLRAVEWKKPNKEVKLVEGVV